MGAFVAEVTPRWSDMDAFGHVNHANMVTIVEEARIALLFTEAVRCGVGEFGNGMVVTSLSVDYLRPLVADGTPVRVEMSVRDLRAAAFTMDYTLRHGHEGRDGHDGAVVARARTTQAPVRLDTGAPRRLQDAERDFLAGWRSGTPAEVGATDG